MPTHEPVGVGSIEGECTVKVVGDAWWEDWKGAFCISQVCLGVQVCGVAVHPPAQE